MKVVNAPIARLKGAEGEAATPVTSPLRLLRAACLPQRAGEKLREEAAPKSSPFGGGGPSEGWWRGRLSRTRSRKNRHHSWPIPEIPEGTKLIKTSVRDALRDAIAEEMRRDPTVFLMGEEVAWSIRAPARSAAICWRSSASGG